MWKLCKKLFKLFQFSISLLTFQFIFLLCIERFALLEWCSYKYIKTFICFRLIWLLLFLISLLEDKETSCTVFPIGEEWNILMSCHSNWNDIAYETCVLELVILSMNNLTRVDIKGMRFIFSSVIWYSFWLYIKYQP